MLAGMVLTLLVAIVPLADSATTKLQARHILAGYPSYSTGEVQTAVGVYLVYLAVVGVIGVAGWLVAIFATRAGKRWARWLATALFVIGTVVALFNLAVTDTSGDTGLSPVIGGLGLFPSLAGLAAVILLWRKPAPVTA
jgi:hypothetical protein